MILEPSIRVFLRGVPVYPVAAATAYILNVYVDSTAAVQGLVRPLIAAIVITAVVQILAMGLLRSAHWGGLLALLVMIGLAAPPIMILGSLGLVVGGLLIGMVRRIPFASLPWTSLTSFLNVVGGVMVLLAIWAGASNGAFYAASPPTRQATQPAEPGSPDIYLILLDGYPRSDTLAEQFGFDNEPFIAAMAERGFDLSRDSHSNYNVTPLTLASMLGMAHIKDVVPAPPQSPKAQYRAVARAVNEGAGLQMLRQAGYEIVAVPSPFSYATPYSADRVLDSGDITDFELALLQTGLSRFILPEAQGSWLAGSHRNRIRSTLAALPRLAAERSTRPKFVLAHVFAPHLPFVFGPDGIDRAPWPCFPERCTLWDDGQRFLPDDDAIPLRDRPAYVSALRDQVAHVNELVLAAADGIIAQSSAPPVIIVLSDHGHRHDAQDREEVFRTILFTRTPGHPGLFPDDATPITVLARIANAYYDAGIALATEERYFVEIGNLAKGGLFMLEPVGN